MDIQALLFTFFGGLALFLFGMNFMSDGLKNIGSNTFRRILKSLTKNRFRAILVGAGITCLIQSSSATSVMVGGVAMANSIFKTFGVLLFLPFLLSGWYEQFVKLIVPGTLNHSNIMFHIAVAHSTFNIINVIIFSLLLWPFLIKIARLLSFGQRVDIERDTKYLDPLLLIDPPIAMQQTIFELIRMTEIAKSAVKDAKAAFLTEDLRKIKSVLEKEDALDELQRSITSYLIQISEKDLDTRESMEYPILLHSVNDIEKIGDYAKNLANYAEIRISRKLKFSKTNLSGIDVMFKALYKLFDNVINSLKEKDSKEAFKAIAIEDKIDEMKIKCRIDYINSLKKHDTNPESAMMIMDIAANIEKMGDHLISISKGVIKDLQWGRKIYLEEE